MTEKFFELVPGSWDVLEEASKKVWYYYPFGLTMAGISSKALGFGGSENKIKYNGYEQQNKEFSDGSGLEWYDYKNRYYDNQIGRFFCVDKLANDFPHYSPYQFAGNQVPNAIDMDGLEEWRRNPLVAGDLFSKSYNSASSTAQGNTELRQRINIETYKAQNVAPTGSYVGPANKTHWVAEQSKALKAESEYYKSIQSATMDPVAGQAGMGLALAMKATAEMPFDIAEHGNNIIQGVNQGDGWKIAGNAALLALDVSSIGFGKVAAMGGSSVLSKGELLRIENAATRINKPIAVVDSRAKGTAGAYSDWDYVIPWLNSKNWSTIKNSLPGSRSILDNTPRNIDIFKGPVNPNLPHITIYPR